MELVFFALSLQIKQLILILIIILAVAYLIGVLVNIPFVIIESRMLDIEIGRTDGKEKAYYKKKKHKLWLSLFLLGEYK